MARKTDLVISALGNLQTTATLLDVAMREHDASLNEVVVRLAQPAYKKDIDRVAIFLSEIATRGAPKNPELAAPDGGCINVVHVPVNPGREWQEAVNAAGPNTPSGYDVRKVADKYPPQSGPVEDIKEIILVNFGRTISDTKVAVDWGKQYKLRPANPRQIFAVGEHKPELHHELGMNPMAVVSPDECFFVGYRQVCFVWWRGSRRYCDLRWFARDWSANSWFAFVRE